MRKVLTKANEQKLAILAVVYVVLFYILASLAIDSGSLWQYAVAFLLLFGAVHSASKVARDLYIKKYAKQTIRSRKKT